MKGFERVSRNLGMEAIEHKDMGCVEFKMNGKSLWYDLQIVVNAFTSKNISEVAELLAQLKQAVIARKMPPQLLGGIAPLLVERL